MPLTWSLATAWPARGAIAVVQVRGDGVDQLLRGLGAGDVEPGRVALREVAGVDRCVLARFDDRTLLMFPHAGKRIVERITDTLAAHGAARAPQDAWSLYPEAHDEVEARMLAALADAASPLAIDLLLDQPRRWRAARQIGEVDESTARVLSRLIRPPLVAAVGLPNVGKSSLLNALAGRDVSVVADAPGTTRDHVGATLDLGGLAVRWMDCPGLGGTDRDPLQAESQELAMAAAAAADLLVVCGDAPSGFPDDTLLPAEPGRVIVALRTDLGLPAGWPGTGVEVSVRQGKGLGMLVGVLREHLVPEKCLRDTRAWRFWDVADGLAGRCKHGCA